MFCAYLCVGVLTDQYKVYVEKLNIVISESVEETEEEEDAGEEDVDEESDAGDQDEDVVEEEEKLEEEDEEDAEENEEENEEEEDQAAVNKQTTNKTKTLPKNPAYKDPKKASPPSTKHQTSSRPKRNRIDSIAQEAQPKQRPTRQRKS